MKTKKLLLVGTSLLILVAHSKVNAYTEYPIQRQEDNIYTKSIIAALSEEDEIVELLNHDITVNDNTYKVATIEKTKNEDVKEVSKQKKETLRTSNQDYIKKHFGEFYIYEDEEYKGKIPISHININQINHGQYQELRKKKINFNNYSKNDLNNIKKEVKENGITYYLINVDWQVDKTEIIDSQEVPKSYKGTMLYQTIVTLNNPTDYEITVTYSGQVNRIEQEYTYKAIYQKAENIIEEPEGNILVPTIIVSGAGIGAIVLILLLVRNNATIYNKTDSGYRVLGSFRLLDNKNNVIDITKYQHKIDSNMYCLKLRKNTYEKIKGNVVYIKIEKITKPITINSRFIEFII